MEHGPFIDDFPIKTSIYKGFSMAMLNNQIVCPSSMRDIKLSESSSTDKWRYFRKVLGARGASQLEKIKLPWFNQQVLPWLESMWEIDLVWTTWRSEEVASGEKSVRDGSEIMISKILVMISIVINVIDTE